MIQKIVTLLIGVVCLGSVFCGLMLGDEVYASGASDFFGVIKLNGSENNVPSDAKGGQHYELINTGIRFILEYNENPSDSVYDRKEVGGAKSKKYYVNFVNMGNNTKPNVKLLIGDNSPIVEEKRNCTFIAPVNSTSVSWEKYLENSSGRGTETVNLFKFGQGDLIINEPVSGEIVKTEINLNSLAEGKSITCNVISEGQKYYGKYYVKWGKATSEDLEVSMTPEGIKLLASIIAARAKNENDEDTLRVLRKIFEHYNNAFEDKNAQIYVKAEILYHIRQDNGHEWKELKWCTYNQIRKWAVESEENDVSLRTGGYKTDNYTYGGWLDFIACKLFEDNPDFTRNKDGKINCSCNYIKQTGLDLKWINFHGKKLYFKVIPGYNWGTCRYASADREVLYTEASLMAKKNKTAPSRDVWCARYLPNACSMDVEGVKNVSLLNYGGIWRYAKTSTYTSNEAINELLCKQLHHKRDGANKNMYNAITAHINSGSATIFEGWDYIKVEYKPIGEVQVREVLITGGTVQELRSENKTELELNKEFTYEKQINHEALGYKYVGAFVESTKPSMIDFNDKINYPLEVIELKNPSTVPAYCKNAEEVIITPTYDNLSYTITFVYEKVYLPLEISFKGIHWDNKNKNEIELPSIKTEYSDISELVQELYCGTYYAEDRRVQYNNIVSDTSKTLGQKLEKILNMIYDDGVWDNGNIPVLKSINSLNVPEGHYGVKYVGLIDGHANKNTPNAVAIKEFGHIYTHVEVNNFSKVGTNAYFPASGQYSPDLSHIIDEVRVTSNINHGDELTIVFLYEPEMKIVTVEHRDKTTGEMIPGTATVQIPVVYGEYLSENPKANLGLTAYSYKGYEVDSNGIYNLTTEAVLGVITENILVTFWYEKEPEVDGEIIPEEENNQEIPDPGNPLATGEKTIVLDDLFTLNVSIINYDVLEAESKVYVEFPFDVYYNDDFHKQAEAILIEKIVDPIAGVVVPVEKNYDPYTFRLPSWIIEKSYPEGARIYITDPAGNIMSEKKLSIRVIGRLYDFTVTNLENDSNWKQILFNDIEKEYKAAQLPIGQNTLTNVTYQYGMKLGSTFLYSLNTKGLKSDKIQIDTKVIYVDKDGNPVDATFYYQVAGEGERKFDNANNSFSTALNKQARTIEEVREEITKGLELLNLSGTYIRADISANNGIKNAFANIINAYKNFAPTVERKFGNFNTMTLPNTLRTPFANYIEKEVENIGKNPMNLPYGDSEKYINQTNAINMKANEIINSVGHWYAEYRLPASLYAKDNAGNRLPDDGYYIVLFNIQSLDKDEKPYLSYFVPGSNSQWEKENPAGITENKVMVILPKIVGQTSVIPITIDISAGYYPVAIYQAGMRTSNDFELGATH